MNVIALIEVKVVAPTIAQQTQLMKTGKTGTLECLAAHWLNATRKAARLIGTV